LGQSSAPTTEVTWQEHSRIPATALEIQVNRGKNDYLMVQNSPMHLEQATLSVQAESQLARSNARGRAGEEIPESIKVNFHIGNVPIHGK
jgi:hypothetical protein